MTLKTKQELASSVYFVVGRGTEGGAASYKISVAGVTDVQWQSPVTMSDPATRGSVKLNSGYTIGAMQLDLGVRGTLAVGSTSSVAKAGEQSYLDAVIAQSKAYAAKNNLPFPTDTSNLRDALLTHGNGGLTDSGKTRTSITFIDSEARDTINAWGSSSEGRNWIHKNVDMPIVNDAASKAYDVVQKYGADWSDDDKNLAALELAKVYNQTGNLKAAKASLDALKDPSFEDLTAALAGNLHAPKALDIGASFEKAGESDMATWLDSAQKKILAPNFDPAQFTHDPDLKLALQLTKSKSTDVVIEDDQLSIKVGNQTYRYTMSDDKSTVNLDIVKGAGTSKETVVGGECFNSQAVLNGFGPVQAGTAATSSAGHWEDTTQYDQEGNVISSEGRVWVAEVPAATNTSISIPTPAAPINHTTTGRTYLSRDGASATLPDGTLVNAGSGGYLELNSQGGLVVSRPASGYGDAEGSVTEITTYSAAGQVTGSVLQQTLPGQSEPLAQGQERILTYTTAEGATGTVTAQFQVGVGWVDPGTGESVLSLKDWQSNPELGSGTPPAAPMSGNDFQDALINAFQNPPVISKENDTQLADAGSDTVSDAGPGSAGSQETANGSASNQPAALAEPAQTAPETIAEQTPPTPTPATPAQPFVQYGSEYNATLQPYAQALNLLKSLDGLQHWDQLGDVGKLTTAMSLYTQLDSLGTTYGSGEHNLWGGSGVGTALSYISLAQSIESGNILGTLSSVNAIGDQALDGAINSALGSSGVPYVGILMALNDFEHHPGQSIGALVGMCFGPLGSMIGGMIGGFLDEALASKPPPPEGATHFEWDDQGNIQIRVDRNQSHGGEIAQNTATSVQSLLQSMVQAINDQTEDTSDNVALNPYLLPKVGFSKEGAWIEISQPDGGTFREHIQGNNLAQRLFDILSDNGGIAPEWQVQTQLGHMHQLLAQGAGQGDISAELGAGAGGHAHAGNQAYALQGNATEAADFKTQSFGALVVHALQSEAIQARAPALESREFSPASANDSAWRGVAFY